MATVLPPGTSLGVVVKRRAVAGITLSETAYSRDLEVPSHSHEHAFFYCVLQGSYTEAFGKSTLTPKPFSLVFHPAGEVHSHRCDGSARNFNVDVAPGWLERVRDVVSLPKQGADLQGGLLSWLAVRLYQEFRAGDAASLLAIEGLALEILAESSRRCGHDAERTPPRWLQHARDLLHERFAESLPLDTIAAVVGVHPVHLARGFRRQYGCTVGGYMRRLRIELACSRLSTSGMPLVEIALDAGFSDQSQFCRSFKRLTGMTPLEFRSMFPSC